MFSSRNHYKKYARIKNFKEKNFKERNYLHFKEKKNRKHLTFMINKCK